MHGNPSSAGGPLLLEAVLRAADVAKIGVAVSLLEPDGSRCVYATETAAALLGVSAPQLVGHSLRDFLLPEDVARLAGLARRMIADPAPTGSVVEVTAVRPDGERVALSLAYSPTSVEGKPAVLTFLINVGEQRATERRVRETAQRLAQLIERAPDAIVISRDGTVVEANPVAARMLGLPSATEMVGRSLSDFILGEDGQAMRDRMMRLQNGEHVGDLRTYRTTRPDGTTLLVEIASFASEYGGHPANVAFGRDVTAREHMHDELVRTERLAALGTLAATVAHEINNPLAAVALNIEVIARAIARASLDAADQEEVVTSLAELRRSVERMAAIVGDLNGFSRGSSDQLGPTDVAGVIDRALRLTRHATSRRATVELSVPPLPMAKANAGRLEQVLVNLLVNAAQALPEARGEAENRIHLRAYVLEPGQLAIEVSDNGVGIPAHQAGRVFDPFFTTKPAGVGTGLGLFVSHAVVRKMGGQIVVDSEPGRGTTMRVSLPLAAPARPRPPDETPTPPTASGRVLVVDDEPGLCRTLELFLRPKHEVVTARGSEEALLALSDGPFDVILCDLMMDGKTGMDLFAQLSAVHPGIEKRVVFMTGGAFTEPAKRFLAACKNPILHKPFGVGELEMAIQQVLGAARMDGASNPAPR